MELGGRGAMVTGAGAGIGRAVALALARDGYGVHRAREYAAAKAGVARLTAALATLAEEGVRVNCICPDFVDTPAARRSLERATPEERAAAPPLVPAERVADAILSLVENDSLAGRVLVCPATEEWRLLPV